jgi:hypothetical protein
VFVLKINQSIRLKATLNFRWDSKSPGFDWLAIGTFDLPDSIQNQCFHDNKNSPHSHTHSMYNANWFDSKQFQVGFAHYKRDTVEVKKLMIIKILCLSVCS